ncbi:MAG: branched-chain amino acid ABC transporter permease [Solirubrobacterales bacterium]|nr:branched-chain amino acid ABC transporter permease [Solirubrobacterales bacterium]
MTRPVRLPRKAGGQGARSLPGRLVKPVLVVVALAISIVFPLVFINPTVTSIAVFTLIFMVSASAWNMFSGYSGYIALGHAAFFGSGAYALAIAANHLGFTGGWGEFALVPLAGVVAGLLSVPFGLIALRARRHTFVVITIAIFFVFQLLAFNLNFTGGSSGLQIPTPLWPAATYNNPFYYVTLGLLVATVAISWLMRGSRFGLQLLAIRDDEERAGGLGVRVGRVKLAAFVASAIPVGMAGALYAYFIGQIFPQFAFDPLFDISIALMAFLGGLGTVWGPVLGALVLESLQQYFTVTFSASQVYLIIYGVLFLAVILLLPRGVIPTVEQWALRWRTRGAREERGGESVEVSRDVVKAAG